MISIKVEKEIRQDHKVLGDLTIRQSVCVAVALVLCAIIYAVTKLDFQTLVPAYGTICVIFGAFGWLKKDGMHLEDYIIRFLKQLVYHNGKILYRTANSYVRLFNTAKKKDLQKAASDGSLKKSERAVEKARKKKLKAYASRKMKAYS